jgi:hypothetical protein
MSRLPRVAAAAVLGVALLCSARANASLTPSARLDIARVFSSQSYSLLGPLLSAPRELSFYSVALFNVAIPSDLAGREVAKLLPAEPARASIARMVNVTGIAPMQSYTAPPAAAYAVPAPQTNAPIEATAPAEKVYAVAPPVTKPEVTAVAPPRFGTYQSYAPSMQSMSAKVDIPVRVGGVHFSGIVSGSESQTSHTDAFRAVSLCGTTDEGSACPYLHESSASSLVAGTNFNVRTGNRNVNLQLSGSVEHLSNGDAAIFPYVPMDPDQTFDPSKLNGTGADSTMLYYPGVSGLVKHGMDARLAVPINRRLTVGLQYNTAHYQGDYGTSMVEGITPGLDARKDTYLGNVTYQLPNANSAITLSTRLYRYQDSLAQNFNLTQTRTDLNFTVKF